MASRRNYVTTTEVDTLIGSGSSTDLQISEAEELIDAYIGPQEKFYEQILTGRAASAGASSLTLQSNQQGIVDLDYYKWCEVEIISGIGAGQRRIITTSTRAGVMTINSSWDTIPDSTSIYRIYQLGKFPRQQDVSFYGEVSPFVYAKQIPEAVKRAAAFQVEFMSAVGDTFFKTTQSDMQSESIGDYSYSRGRNATSGVGRLIAPKAKDILRGIVNRTGQIV